MLGASNPAQPAWKEQDSWHTLTCFMDGVTSCHDQQPLSSREACEGA